MDYAEISVDPKFHRHLIGKGGVNSEYIAVRCCCNNNNKECFSETMHLLINLVNRIKEVHKVTVRIPPDNEKSNLIRIEGDPQGVQEAKKELLELASRMVSSSFSLEAKFCKWFPVMSLIAWFHVGERAYKGLDHRTTFSQGHHWPKRGED